MVMEHCAISLCGISKLSFLEVGYTVNHYNYVRFLRIAIIPFIHQYHGNGHYLLWIDLESAHYANNTLTVLWQQGTCFALKDANPSCVALLRPVEDFWPALKKAIYDEGREATSIRALKRRNKEKAQQIPLPRILCLFNMVNEQLAVCTQEGY